MKTLPLLMFQSGLNTDVLLRFRNDSTFVSLCFVSISETDLENDFTQKISISTIESITESVRTKHEEEQTNDRIANQPQINQRADAVVESRRQQIFTMDEAPSGVQLQIQSYEEIFRPITLWLDYEVSPSGWPPPVAFSYRFYWNS